MRWRAYLAMASVVVMLLLGWAADHYRNRAERWKKDYESALKLTREQSAAITTLQERQRALTELDEKHTQELTDAKNKIDALEHDVAAGRMQLQLHVRCPAAVPAGKATSTASVDDAAGARLTPAAQRDYYTLRKRIETARQQIAGLQDYILQECQK